MLIFSLLQNMQSHPTWVRGLKLTSCAHISSVLMSHPTWVRGLKLSELQTRTHGQTVAPYVGAWIETGKRKNQNKDI